MKIVLRVKLITDWGEVVEQDINEVERPAHRLNPDTLRLRFADGKRVLHRLQEVVVRMQTQEYCALVSTLHTGGREPGVSDVVGHIDLVQVAAVADFV